MFDSGSVQHPSSLTAGIETLPWLVPKHVFKMLGLAVKAIKCPLKLLGMYFPGFLLRELNCWLECLKLLTATKANFKLST